MIAFIVLVTLLTIYFYTMTTAAASNLSTQKDYLSGDDDISPIQLCTTTGIIESGGQPEQSKKKAKRTSKPLPFDPTFLSHPLNHDKIY